MDPGSTSPAPGGEEHNQSKPAPGCHCCSCYQDAHKKDWWDKAEILGSITGAILIPVVLAAGSWFVSNSLDRAIKEEPSQEFQLEASKGASTVVPLANGSVLVLKVTDLTPQAPPSPYLVSFTVTPRKQGAGPEEINAAAPGYITNLDGAMIKVVKTDANKASFFVRAVPAP